MEEKRGEAVESHGPRLGEEVAPVDGLLHPSVVECLLERTLAGGPGHQSVPGLTPLDPFSNPTPIRRWMEGRGKRDSMKLSGAQVARPCDEQSGVRINVQEVRNTYCFLPSCLMYYGNGGEEIPGPYLDTQGIMQGSRMIWMG
ncbi:predicted protein [Aspergillus terreus NIH2624]|uniref:Uncharacterized protein n=1 Tax=Aspergillus terreus (strain NIH 2624 / FGSC A1156) TaxID=341663 RepID=Q0CRC2_ASPTN|nr:uncharacterized protein ATEG_03762 [Aspergillus terreus NIH2624]EAU35564.1 predicted protein [Aspergillus terreus NIH2624]